MNNRSMLAVLVALAILAPPATLVYAQGSGAMNGNTNGVSDTTTVVSEPTSSVDNGEAPVVDTGGNGAGEAPVDTGGGAPADTGGNGATGAPADAGGSGVGGPGGVDEHGGGEEGVGNNLSFPTIAVDGFSIAPLASTTLSVPYTGPYTGLTDTELEELSGHNWYAQKTEGNLWQAAFSSHTIGTPLSIYGVDWGDNVEAVDPLVGQPFRLEVTLYALPADPMGAYTMHVLANPSSPDETQGTNSVIYTPHLVAVASARPMMLVQYLGTTATSTLTWDGSTWTSGGVALPADGLVFGPELNVGGKYVYGAAEGGWRPTHTGAYRLTFYAPSSDLSFADAAVGNYDVWDAALSSTTPTTTEETEEETGAATPVIDVANNLTYVDVTAVDRHEGRMPEEPGGEGEDEETVDATTSVSGAVATASTAVPSAPTTTDAVDMLATEPVVVPSNPTCEVSIKGHMGSGRTNDSSEVEVLQKFLNDTMGTNIPITGYFGSQTLSAVKDFQVAHADTVLKPWIDAGHTDVSMDEGTGYVGATTIGQINTLLCE